jgi:hypothetical protein
MPNYCENKLRIYGPSEELARFHDGLGPNQENGILRTYAPAPEVLDKSLYPDWNIWGQVNWGTKWSERDLTFIDQDAETPVMPDGSYGYRFLTAWSPPERGLTTISTKFPTLTFELIYDEGAMCFAGGTIIRDGKVIVETFIGGEDYPDLGFTDDNEPNWDEYEDLKDTLFARIENALMEGHQR